MNSDIKMSKRQFLVGAGSLGLVLPLSGCLGLGSGIDKSLVTASIGRYGPTPSFSLGQAQAVVNQYRGQNGLGPLRIQKQLQQAAVNQAQLMAKRGQMKHSFGSATSFRRRVRAVGFRGNAAENIAAGQKTLDAVVQAWMKSPGHRKNMLNRRYHSFGLAVHTNPQVKYGHYWAMVLGV